MGNEATHSLLDRFFISHDWEGIFDNSKATRVVCINSNPFPIFLETGNFVWVRATSDSIIPSSLIRSALNWLNRSLQVTPLSVGWLCYLQEAQEFKHFQ